MPQPPLAGPASVGKVLGEIEMASCGPLHIRGRSEPRSGPRWAGPCGQRSVALLSRPSRRGNVMANKRTSRSQNKKTRGPRIALHLPREVLALYLRCLAIWMAIKADLAHFPTPYPS